MASIQEAGVAGGKAVEDPIPTKGRLMEKANKDKIWRALKYFSTRGPNGERLRCWRPLLEDAWSY